MKKIAIAISVLFCVAVAAAQPLGDPIGTTLYWYQNAGPTGRRITVGGESSIYVCWTNLVNWPYPSGARHVYYNWRNPEYEWFEGNGEQVSTRAGSGFCNVDMINSDRGAIIYHQSDNIILSIEYMPGLGVFDNYSVPNEIFPQNFAYPGICQWPQMTIDRNNRIQVLLTENTPDNGPRRIAYTRSDDDGLNWLDPMVMDTIASISGGIVSSPVSDRVAISCTDLIDTASQYNYWPFYIISEDGMNWNIPDGLTQVPYRYPQHNQRWGNYNQTAIFDFNDNLHIAWPAYGDSADWLLHYDVGNDTVTVISELYGPPDHALTSPMIVQVSLSRKHSSSIIVATWCQFADGDTNTAGVYNGDIFVSESYDNGISWRDPINITNTRTPACAHMECSSEIYPSAPEEISMVPQFTYIYNPYLDINNYPDSSCTVMYVDRDNITDIPINTGSLPQAFSLSQNYPNPFNAKTEIAFSLTEPARVELAIYDLLGRKVENLLDGFTPAGPQNITWDAGDLPSGMYFYRLKADDYTETRKCLLLK